MNCQSKKSFENGNAVLLIVLGIAGLMGAGVTANSIFTASQTRQLVRQSNKVIGFYNSEIAAWNNIVTPTEKEESTAEIINFTHRPTANGYQAFGVDFNATQANPMPLLNFLPHYNGQNVLKFTKDYGSVKGYCGRFNAATKGRMPTCLEKTSAAPPIGPTPNPGIPVCSPQVFAINAFIPVPPETILCGAQCNMAVCPQNIETPCSASATGELYRVRVTWTPLWQTNASTGLATAPCYCEAHPEILSCPGDIPKNENGLLMRFTPVVGGDIKVDRPGPHGNVAPVGLIDFRFGKSSAAMAVNIFTKDPISSDLPVTLAVQGAMMADGTRAPMPAGILLSKFANGDQAAQVLNITLTTSNPGGETVYLVSSGGVTVDTRYLEISAVANSASKWVITRNGLHDGKDVLKFLAKFVGRYPSRTLHLKSSPIDDKAYASDGPQPQGMAGRLVYVKTSSPDPIYTITFTLRFTAPPSNPVAFPVRIDPLDAGTFNTGGFELGSAAPAFYQTPHADKLGSSFSVNSSNYTSFGTVTFKIPLEQDPCRYEPSYTFDVWIGDPNTFGAIKFTVEWNDDVPSSLANMNLCDKAGCDAIQSEAFKVGLTEKVAEYTEQKPIYENGKVKSFPCIGYEGSGSALSYSEFCAGNLPYDESTCLQKNIGIPRVSSPTEGTTSIAGLNNFYNGQCRGPLEATQYKTKSECLASSNLWKGPLFPKCYYSNSTVAGAMQSNCQAVGGTWQQGRPLGGFGSSNIHLPTAPAGSNMTDVEYMHQTCRQSASTASNLSFVRTGGTNHTLTPPLTDTLGTCTMNTTLTFWGGSGGIVPVYVAPLTRVWQTSYPNP